MKRHSNGRQMANESANETVSECPSEHRAEPETSRTDVSRGVGASIRGLRTWQNFHSATGLVWTRFIVCLRPLVLCFVAVVLLALMGTVAEAKDKPRVRLKMELMSIRNRSSGPLPVRIRVEYNDPQILEGDLELSIYDGLDVYSRDDLMATVRHEGIVLAGRDYEFNVVLPPLRTGVTQNWAIEAWFITKDGRIPLSSIPDRPNPPEAHDLLTTSPLERGVLLCSCSADPQASSGNSNRRFLEAALSLDNYNPLYAELEGRAEASNNLSATGSQVEKIGRTIIHFPGQWAARDLPEDPLSYCAFDAVLLCDGALGKLNAEQLSGLTKWVRAGGSVCIVPDSRLKPQHLEFLRTLMQNAEQTIEPSGEPPAEQSRDKGAQLTLDDEGQLLVIDDKADGVRMSHFGLGRAILLPAVEDLEQRLSPEEMGRIVAFFWKVRKDQPVWRGEDWLGVGAIRELQRRGIEAQEDERGIYVVKSDSGQYAFYGGHEINGRMYIDLPQLKAMFGIDHRLSPKTEPLLAYAEQLLLPADAEMVPAHVIGLILAGYVLTIGPVDYFVLGWLRLRKLTWLLFPLVTLIFTLITIAVAHRYMGSDDTGGRLVITDLVEGGIAARETVLETMFMGAQSDIKTEHTAQLVVQAEDSFTAADWQGMYSGGQGRPADAPLSYTGHFPQKFSITQQVSQWSPVSLRTLCLEPEPVKLPPIDWDDFSLINTEEGNRRLAASLVSNARSTGLRTVAVIYHNDQALTVVGGSRTWEPIPRLFNNYYSNAMTPPSSRDEAIGRFLSYLPTINSTDQSFFQIVSQVSPQGAGSLEDLAFVDPSDPAQWGLAIMQTDGHNFHVFRKLYLQQP